MTQGARRTGPSCVACVASVHTVGSKDDLARELMLLLLLVLLLRLCAFA